MAITTKDEQDQPKAQQQQALHELSEQIIDVVKLGTMVCTELNPVGVLHPNMDDVVDVVVEAVIDNIQNKTTSQKIITN